MYGVRTLKKSLTLDTYYLGLDRKAAAFNRGVAQEVRHTIGARLSRPIAQTKPGWDFDYEALWQFGTFGSADIRAWTVASETGYRFPTLPLKPRFSVKADISSGDDPRTNTLGTFNPLFPKGNYFGVLATAGPGPINFIDVHPHVETLLPHSVTASVDWIFQWRESLARRSVFRPRISDYSRRKEQRAFRRESSRHGGALASESSPLVSSRLRNFLRGEIREGESASPQPQLLGIVGRLQVLGRDPRTEQPF